MFKKFFNFVFNCLIILGSIGVIYYFYTSSQTNSLLKNGSLSHLLSEDTSNITLIDNVQPINNLYYYNQLDENSKLIYSALENNIDNLKDDNFTIDFSTKFNDLLNTSTGKISLDKSFQSALDAFFYDHPELFYIDLTKITLFTRYTSFGSKTTYTVSIAPSDNENYLTEDFSSKEQVEEAIIKVENLRNNIVNNVSGDVYNKALIVHDTLVDLLEYDQTTNRANTHNIYGALIENKVVCEGYAKAYKYIMDSLNIPCILVSGKATNNSGKTEPHMWNYVQIDNVWYGVDATWDDPIIIGGPSSGTIRRTYFCKGYYSFSKSHFPENKISDSGMAFSLPKLSKENYK